MTNTMTRREARQGRVTTPSARQDTAPEAPEESWDAFTQRGHRPKRSGLKARLGFYKTNVEGAPSTTRQVEILNTNVIASPADDMGLLVGRDTLSRAPIAHDPAVAYQNGIINSTNTVVVGDVGSAKSSLLKTLFAARALILEGRRVVVFDKKPETRDGEERQGEYGPLATKYGVKPIRLQIGQGGSCINILDKNIYGEGGGEAAQYRLLLTAAELAQNGKPLDQWEGEALRVAHRHAVRQAGIENRDILLADVIDDLGLVRNADYPHVSDAARERMHQAGLGIKYVLNRLRSTELGGLFDGPTSEDIQLNAKLTVFDFSDLPEEGPAIPLAMMVANAWLMGVIAGDPGKVTHLIVEEGWHLAGGPAGKVMRSNQKLQRALGLVIATAFHHLSDIPEDDPAIAMIKEAETLFLYRQGRRSDAELCERLLNLRPGAAHTLMNLPKGTHLLKIGRRPEVRVQHVRSRFEIDVTNTDSALAGTSRKAG